MREERTIRQIVLETRNIKAVFTDDGGSIKEKLPVFAWALFDDNAVEPLFISREHFAGGFNPQTANDIKYLSGGKLEILNFEWENQNG